MLSDSCFLFFPNGHKSSMFLSASLALAPSSRLVWRKGIRRVSTHCLETLTGPIALIEASGRPMDRSFR